MAIQDKFNSFLAKLELDPTRVGRIRSAYSRLEEFCLGDPGIAQYAPRLFLQGSFSNGLAISPARSNAEYDVDVVLLMALPTARPGLVLNWLAERLSTQADYKRRIIRKDKCVRLNYARDFHLDVVPAHRVGGDNDPITIPSRTSGWQYSHPMGYEKWCDLQSQRTFGDFGRAVRMLKRWRDRPLSGVQIPSIILTTLVGPFVPARQGLPDSLVIAQTLGSLGSYLQALPRRPAVQNPSLLTEDLAPAWPQSQYLEFRRRVIIAAQIAARAASATESSAAILWRRVLGSDFPVSP